jgi:hypothetical protein
VWGRSVRGVRNSDYKQAHTLTFRGEYFPTHLPSALNP